MSRIAPRPPNEPPPSSSRSDSAEKESGRKQPPRKNVTVACQVCRERRTKCDGGVPCSRCVRTGAECVYAHDLDGRSQTAIKRKYEKIQVESDLLTELLSSIRDNSDDQVSQIVSLIRSNAPLPELQQAIRQQRRELQQNNRRPSPDLDRLENEVQRLGEAELVRRSLPGSRRDVLQINRLISLPRYHVSARPWTVVTSDDELVSHLISVWLTWDKPWYDWMSHELFIRDMQTGDLSSLYCSPFLVSCILACACPYSDWSESRSRRGTVSPLMLGFIEEAKNQLEVVIAQGPSLPTLQGLIFLFLAISLRGQDRLGYQYMLQAVEMAQELVTAPQPKLLSDDEDNIDDYELATDWTCWGVFNVTTATHMMLMKHQKTRPPRRSKPAFGDKSTQRETWSPYPRPGDSSPSFVQQLMIVRCDIAVFEAVLTGLLFDVDEIAHMTRKDLEHEILRVYEAISRRLDEMPSHLKVMEGANSPVLTHALWFLCVKMRVFLFLKQPVDGASSTVRQMAQESCIEAAVEVARICRIHMQTYVSAPINSNFIHGTSMALYIFNEFPDTSSYHPQITDICVCLRALSRRWPMSMAILRMVQLDARKFGNKLPPETDKLFEDFEKDDWRTRETINFVSMYPSPDEMASRKTEKLDMGKFLSQMTSLEIDSRSDADGDPGSSSQIDGELTD